MDQVAASQTDSQSRVGLRREPSRATRRSTVGEETGTLSRVIAAKKEAAALAGWPIPLSSKFVKIA